jgi:hypothetical protein
MRRRFLAEIYWRNPLLTLVGWLHVVLLLAAMVGYVTDDRAVAGVDPWLTPLKLMPEIAIYVWTVAWFSKYIRRPRWLLSTGSIVIAAAMVIESSCLILQAARGTVSFYNVATDFDAAIFRAMCIMIGINMLMLLVVLLTFGKRGRLHPAYLWGVRTGILLFLCGGAVGGVMLATGLNMAGASTASPTLLFFNWAAAGGGGGLAHWLSLHALQILPLTGNAIGGWSAVPKTPAKLVLLALAVSLYAVLIVAAVR